MDWVDAFIFEGLHLLVAEDGENLRSRKTPIAFLADGQFWVNNHAHILQGNEANDTRFLAYALEASDVSGYLSGSTQPKLTQQALSQIPIRAPDLPEQQGISRTLGALDDKIESNNLAAIHCLDLAQSHFTKVCGSARKDRLGSLAHIVLGGTPDRKRSDYWTDGTVAWINSGSANEDIIIEPNEFITEEALAKSAAKIMPSGASVVAITGATLGQVALLGIPTSGNQSLVGLWSDDADLNAWLHFAVRSAMPDLLGTATGAAQQHVNKSNVDELQVPVVGEKELRSWAQLSKPLLDLAVALRQESLTLVKLRDTLIPGLLSGSIRVREAVQFAEAVA